MEYKKNFPTGDGNWDWWEKEQREKLAELKERLRFLSSSWSRTTFWIEAREIKAEIQRIEKRLGLL